MAQHEDDTDALGLVAHPLVSICPYEVPLQGNSLQNKDQGV